METSEHTIILERRTIMYDVTGDGPPIVFVHGVWATGGLWYGVIDRLADRFRCINIHLPLGVHQHPSPPDVDHSPHALARVIAGLMDALNLYDVTLVGNDTGGALCQLVVAAGAPRVGRLVLTNCDAFEVFPPRVLAPLYAAARVPALWWLVAQLTRRQRTRRRFWSLVAHAEPDRPLLDMLLDRFATQGPIREDLRLTICAVDRAQTLAAARTFSTFDPDVLVLWGTDDVFFPVALGRRLASAFPNSVFQAVRKAKLFVPIDQPDVVATAIAGFTDRNFAAIPVALNATPPPATVHAVLELVGTGTLLDSLLCVRQGGSVCMTGMVGNRWSLNDFSPMDAIPTAVNLTTYAGGSHDFVATPLQELVDQIASGALRVSVGKVFRLDDIVEAHRCMEENKAGGKIVVLTET